MSGWRGRADGARHPPPTMGSEPGAHQSAVISVAPILSSLTACASATSKVIASGSCMPAAGPKDGGCTPAGGLLACEYGGNANGACTTFAECAALKAGAPLSWIITPAAPGCGQNAAACPGTYGI